MAVYKDLLLREGGGILPSGRTAGWREIYPGLAAKFFEGFERMQGSGGQYPTEAEIQGLARQAGIGSVESLLCEITGNGADSELTSPPNLSAFMQFVLEHGDQALVDFYLGQKREKLSRLALDACRMAEEEQQFSDCPCLRAAGCVCHGFEQRHRLCFSGGAGFLCGKSVPYD